MPQESWKFQIHTKALKTSEMTQMNDRESSLLGMALRWAPYKRNEFNEGAEKETSVEKIKFQKKQAWAE